MGNLLDEIRERKRLIEVVFKTLEKISDSPLKSIPILYMAVLEDTKHKIEIVRKNGVKPPASLVEAKEALEMFKDEIVNSVKTGTFEALVEELHFIHSTAVSLLSFVERRAALLNKEIHDLTKEEVENLIQEFTEKAKEYGTDVKPEISYLIGTTNNTNVFKRLPVPGLKR